MRLPKTVASCLLFSMISWTAVSAAEPAISQNDCQKVGGEVSALIDSETASPNLPAARAVFQRGIMNCMEGDSDEANKLYLEAKKLLGNASFPTPASASAAPAPLVLEDNCQTLGSEVSALIDKERASSNIASVRAVFQRGVMACMEDDTAEANRLYREAKRVLAVR